MFGENRCDIQTVLNNMWIKKDSSGDFRPSTVLNKKTENSMFGGNRCDIQTVSNIMWIERNSSGDFAR